MRSTSKRSFFSRAGALLLAAMAVCAMPAQAAGKPRVMVLTDIENEPDDAMSLVRFLVYANHYSRVARPDSGPCTSSWR